MAPPAIPEEPAPDPRPEIVSRLREEGLNQDDFLNLLTELGLIDIDSNSIEMGHFTIGHCPEDVLHLALKDWDNVVKKLKGAIA